MIEINVKLKVDTTELDRAIAKAKELRSELKGEPYFVFTACESPSQKGDVPVRTCFREYREKKKINQEAMAEQLGVTQSTIAIWETGRAMPRADKLPEIARVLGCEVSDLFAKEG